MVNEGKPPAAAIAAFAFALLYVGVALLTQLPFLLSRQVPPVTGRAAAVRTGALVGVIVECAAIAALGFATLKKRTWAAWLLVVLATVEIVLTLARQSIINAVLPLMLGSLAWWAARSLRADES
jgi:hypothetical protein